MSNPPKPSNSDPSTEPFNSREGDEGAGDQESKGAVQRKGCLDRWFSPMDKGSFRAGVLSLTATAIGGGVLTLPYVCKTCGIGLGLIMLFLGFLSALWSFSLLVKANERAGGCKTYKEFCTKCGGRGLHLAYDFSVIFTIFGSLIGYQVIVADMVQAVLRGFGCTNPEELRLYHIIGTSIIVIFPICLLWSINTLRYATLLSIGAVIYTSILLIVELPFYWDSEKAEKEIKYFYFSPEIFGAFGITFFAFYCQVGFFPAIENLEKYDTLHINKLVKRSLYFDIFFYSIIAITGYLSTFESTPDLVVTRKPFPPYSYDVFLMIAQISIAGALCITIPLNFVPLRTSIFNHIFSNQELTYTKTILASGIFTIASGILTVFLPDITSVLSIVGGIGCVAISYVIPLLAYLSTFPELRLTGYINILIGAVISALGVGSALNGLIKAL